MVAADSSRRATVAVFLMLVSIGLTRPASSQSLEYDAPYVGWETGQQQTARYPWTSVVADLDNDGDPDVVAGNWPSHAKLSVIRNEGDGTFRAPETYPTVLPVLGVAVSDFDADGFLDVVAANTGVNYEGTSVALFRNDGAGGFLPQELYTAGQGSFPGIVGLVADDFDGDGDDDLVATNFGFIGQGERVALLVNDGTGSFAAPLYFPAGLAPYDLAAGDLDDDGLPDLVVAREKQRISVLRNTGGAFAAPVSYAGLGWVNTDVYPTVAIGDVENDGDLDVVYSSTGMQSGSLPAVALYRNQGDGTLAAASPILGANCVDLHARDLDEDGWVDVFGPTGNADSWMLFAGAGFGGFSGVQTFEAGEDPTSMDVGDVDGDGTLDVVSVARGSLEACVHRNDGAANFSPPTSYPVLMPGDVPALGEGIASSDIDGDGDVDLAGAWSGTVFPGGGIGVLRNLGGGTFSGANVYYSSPAKAKDVQFQDVDGDGWDDLIWADAGGPNGFKTRRNLGNGSFGLQQSWPMGTCNNGDMIVADLDADGDRDVALADAYTCQPPLVFLSANAGDGTFSLPMTTVVDLFPEGIDAGDYDQDGVIDLVTTHNSWVGVVLGDGAFGFGTPILSQTDWAPKHVVTRDLDGDGILDAATANWGDLGSGGESMSVLMGRGDGSFRPPTHYAGSFAAQLASTKTIRAGDTDGDADTDLLVSWSVSKDVSLYRNQGDGTFAPQIRFGGGGTGMVDVTIADLTGDGVDDLGAMIMEGGALTFYPAATVLPGNVGCAGTIRNYGPGCRGSGAYLPSLRATGCPTPGDAFTLNLFDAYGGTTAFLMFGTGTANQPLANGCRLLVSGLVAGPIPVPIPGSGAGTGTFSLTLGVPAALPPTTLTAQMLVLDPGAPGGYVASNGVRLEIR